MINNGLFATMGLGVGMALAVALLWVIIWKGFALWIAAREEKKWWFIALLVLNTVGILEIIYIFAFSKTGKNCIDRFRNPVSHKATQNETKASCDCATCEGCECDCHKPIESN